MAQGRCPKCSKVFSYISIVGIPTKIGFVLLFILGVLFFRTAFILLFIALGLPKLAGWILLPTSIDLLIVAFAGVCSYRLTISYFDKVTSYERYCLECKVRMRQEGAVRIKK